MSDKSIRIDIDKVLRAKLPRHYRYVPAWVVTWLKRTIHQDQLNDLLQRAGDRTGVEFAQFALNDLDITVNVRGMEQLATGRRYIFAANHPLGGVDGLALISVIGQHYCGNIRFLVNDLLMAVKPLASIFLPVNKHGKQSRDAAQLIKQQYGGDNQMLTFPAGLCSRLQRDGKVADLEWHKHVVVRAVGDQRDIVPVWIDAQNSPFFYRLARWRTRLGIKFNVEMLYLPDEMFKKRHTSLNITVGKPIAWQELDSTHAQEQAAQLRSIVFSLNDLQRHEPTHHSRH